MSATSLLLFMHSHRSCALASRIPTVVPFLFLYTPVQGNAVWPNVDDKCDESHSSVSTKPGNNEKRTKRKVDSIFWTNKEAAATRRQFNLTKSMNLMPDAK